MNIATKLLFTSITILSLLSFPVISSSQQQFHRIKSQYSVKYTDSKGNQILQMGDVYYDSNSKKLVMKNGFPVREILVHKDSMIYQVRSNRLVGTSPAYSIVDLSIFHMALTGELNNFGLDAAGYRLENVTSDKGLILTTWAPPEAAKNTFGKILVSTKNKQLFGIVFLDPNEKILAKHFYRKYKNTNGFVFPMEVLRIIYEGNKESYKLTTYQNLVVNGEDNEYYNFEIPK